ncbi:MAG: mechanosensitive ion channel family protein, partial [Gammaproteobacteria bacterium]|nr:mechanosensitive ion channel family protein [Gammaproteobacteria bacterium]
CELGNPVAEICLRLPINDLVGQNSRPTESDEPWFPCKKNDWVLLNDGIRGKVTGISMEMVQLIERGGARKTYQTSDFLACSPRNLSTNFRIKETIGISYSLQQQSTGDILETLYQYIQQKIEQEGYTEQMLNLRVEFQSAGESSLDLVIIADFDGQIADLYNRLRRAIQRWSVDACTQNNWEIPFPQRTLHMVSEITEN